MLYLYFVVYLWYILTAHTHTHTHIHTHTHTCVCIYSVMIGKSNVCGGLQCSNRAHVRFPDHNNIYVVRLINSHHVDFMLTMNGKLQV